jgi:hypothetical protein
VVGAGGPSDAWNRPRCWPSTRRPARASRRRTSSADLSELGQSLGLGPSVARSGRAWRTIERLVGFGMAHWLAGDEVGVRTEVAPLSGRQLARVPE